MLTIRMQRTGRKGLANFRVVVQDSRFSPSSGRVVAQLGHYNPHTKELVLNAELATQYLKNGAQPSSRVIQLLKEKKVELPSWVKEPALDKKRATRNPEKLRKNQPKELSSEDEVAPTSDSVAGTEEAAVEAPAEDALAAEDKAADVPVEETVASEEKTVA